MRALAVIAAAAVIGFAGVATAHTLGGEQEGPVDGNTGGMMEQHRAMMQEHHAAMPDMGYYQERLMDLSDRLRAGNLSRQDQIQIGEDLSRMAEAMEVQDMIGMTGRADTGVSADGDGSDTE